MLRLRIMNLAELLLNPFQWAPTLGGECYQTDEPFVRERWGESFNGHPPLGVNATKRNRTNGLHHHKQRFNGHPPLGVNATGGHTIPTTGSA